MAFQSATAPTYATPPTPVVSGNNQSVPTNPNINIGNVGGQGASQAIVKTIYDYTPDAFMRDIYVRHAENPSFRAWVKALGGSRPASAPIIGHFERDWVCNSISFGTIPSDPGAGQPITVPLAAGMMYNAGATVGGSARQASAPRVNDIVILPNGTQGQITAKNVSVTPHTVTIKPLQAAKNFFTSLTAATEYFLVTNAWGEGTGLPDGIMPRLYRYANAFQIIKDTYSMTGSELTNQLFVNTSDGGIGGLLRSDAMVRQERNIGNALIFSTPVDNLSVASAIGHDVPVTGTEGLIPFVTSNGYIDGYTVGSYTVAEFDDVAAIYQKEMVKPRNISVFEGYAHHVSVENAMQSALNYDLTPFLFKGMNSELAGGDNIVSDSDWSFMTGYSAIKKAGYTFHFKVLDELNSATGAGLSGYAYKDYGIFMPVSVTADRVTGGKAPTVGYAYKSMNGRSREFCIDSFGGVGAAGSVGGDLASLAAVNANDVFQVGFLSEVASHFACPNLTVIQRP